MTYLAKPKLHHPTLQQQRARLHAPRLRRQDLARCAPAAATTRSRPRSSRPAGSSTSSRTASPSCRASAARRRRPTTSSATRTASTPCTAACRSVLTGANLANRELLYLGVSGDGDSASIGLGQFAHAMRRGVNMTYIVENNGVYGLTKGQFSATADRRQQEQEGRGQHRRADRPGVARAAARRELRRAQLLRRQGAAGAADQGRACATAAPRCIDVISPCVAFNNHAGSTKSYDYVREHNEAVNRLDFMPSRRGAHGELRAGRGDRGDAARRQPAAPAQAAPRLRPRRPPRRR